MSTTTRTTVTLDDDVLRAVRIRAARTGKRDSEVIEAALRRDLALDLLDELWATNDLDEDQAMDLALEAQAAVRADDAASE
jgi:plasmid stability protein